MPVLLLLGGLRRYGHRERHVDAPSVADALARLPVPPAVLFPGGRLNADVAVLVNGRNITFLNGLDTPLAANDRITVFLHGARGFPGG